MDFFFNWLYFWLVKPQGDLNSKCVQGKWWWDGRLRSVLLWKLKILMDIEVDFMESSNGKSAWEPWSFLSIYDRKNNGICVFDCIRIVESRFPTSRYYLMFHCDHHCSEQVWVQNINMCKFRVVDSCGFGD